MNLLKIVMEDKDDWAGYFIYELDFGNDSEGKAFNKLVLATVICLCKCGHVKRLTCRC